MNKKIRHPAKFTDVLLPVFARHLQGCVTVLDCFAGTGKIHLLPFDTVGLEIEPEWSNMHPNTITGDATKMPFNNESFDAVCTSPTYANRMSDHHNAKDTSERNTYTHKLGRQLHENNSGKMNWGQPYQSLHEKAWLECFRVLKPEGKLILNFKNHIKNGKEVDVFSWHIKTLIDIGFKINEIEKIKTNGNGFGANAKLRTGFEYVAVLIKPS